MGSKRADMIAERTRKHRESAARAADGFVRTPAGMAEELASGHRDLMCLPSGARVLEPSAGDGALVRAILEHNPAVEVIAVEPSAERSASLAASVGAARVSLEGCTLEVYAETHADSLVDAVIMNPPFGDSGRADLWIDHVRLAWQLLRPGGVLVSIVPPSYATRQTARHRQFRQWAESVGATYRTLPGQPFSESGTGTRAGVLTVPRPMPDRPCGRATWIADPASGIPVPVAERDVSARAAVDMPVQEYADGWDGFRPKVIRYAGTCHACGRVCWEHDGRGGSQVWETSNLDADEFGMVGPSMVMCVECSCSNADGYARAVAAGQELWAAAPDGGVDRDAAGPNVYPMDLGAGVWATVHGIEENGRDMAVTGRVMSDPVQGVGLVRLQVRTAGGVDVDVYADPGRRVIVRDIPADVVPAAGDTATVTGVDGAGQPVTVVGMVEHTAPVATVGTPRARVRVLADPYTVHTVYVDQPTAPARRLVARRVPEVGSAVYDQDTGEKVSPAGDAWWPNLRRARQEARTLQTTTPAPVPVYEPADPYVSAWAQLSLPV